MSNVQKHEQRLSDYQIAEAFGDTLSSIYKEKIDELDQNLHQVMNFLETLNLPRYNELDRWFAREALPDWAKRDMKAIEHINKIRKLHLKLKRNPSSERLNIEKAKSVPITSIYEFKGRGNQVSCPFHKDEHPSASIKYNRLICFQCGEKLDGIALFMKLNKVSFHDAVKILSR